MAVGFINANTATDFSPAEVWDTPGGVSLEPFPHHWSSFLSSVDIICA